MLVLFCFNDSTNRFLPEPLTFTMPGNLFPLLHTVHKSSFDNFKCYPHFKGSSYLVSSLLCPIYFGGQSCKYPGHCLSIRSFAISLFLILWNHHGFCLARLVSDTWVTPILNVGIFLDSFLIYYHLSYTPTCVGHLVSGLRHTGVDFLCSPFGPAAHGYSHSE